MSEQRGPGRAESWLPLALAGGRFALGAAIWAAPDRALGALGFDPSRPAIRALGRLAGTRDLATGALALEAHGRPSAVRRALLLNAAIDAGDALAFGLALRSGERDVRRAGAVGAPSALVACLAGLGLARHISKR